MYSAYNTKLCSIVNYVSVIISNKIRILFKTIANLKISDYIMSFMLISKYDRTDNLSFENERKEISSTLIPENIVIHATKQTT